jgi:hypothetical protein
MTTPTVFISYCQKDTVWRERLEKHLRPAVQQTLLDIWHDGRIDVKHDWLPQIEKAMGAARVAILLISSDFLGSDFILRKEVPVLLESRRKEGMTVIPLLLTPCLWDMIPWLARMTIRPDPKRPLSGYKAHQRDECLAALAREICGLLEAPLPSSTGTRNTSDLIPPVEEVQCARRTALENRLERLSSETIADEESGQELPALLFLYNTLKCTFETEPQDLPSGLARFLTEPAEVTLPRLVRAHLRACDLGRREIANQLGQIIDLVTPLQIPVSLWRRVLEQLKQGQSVLERAAGGLLCAEVLTARVDGKHITISHGADNKLSARNMIGQFSSEQIPLGLPEGDTDLVLKHLYLSKHLGQGPDRAATQPNREETARVLKRSFETHKVIHDRVPYLVVKLPQNPDDRTHWMRVLAQVSREVEHLIVVELSTDPNVKDFEEVLLTCLNTRFDSERKWKTT